MDYDDLLAGAQPIEFPPAGNVRRYRNLRIPTRDGSYLAADVYLPKRKPPDGRLPIVMEYIPYCKDHVDLTLRPFYLRLPVEGYLFVRVDIRGTGASPGVSRDEYLPIEQQDGYDAIEWLAAQSWCTGQVNMMGISYGGFTSLQVAGLAPPHLTTIIPVDFTDDRYRDDCHYRGGLMRLYYDLAHYGGSMIASNAMPPLWEAADADDWAAIWQERLEGSEPYILNWYRNQVDGPYWGHGSVGRSPETIQCPVFMIGGWQDGYMNCNLRLFEKLVCPKKLLIGPWNHAMPDMAVPGPRIDYMREVVRWLDHWCKGCDTGILSEAPVVVFMQAYQQPDPNRLDSAGQWRAEETWPVPGGREMALWLGSQGHLSSELGAASHDLLQYDATVGLHGGLFSGGLPFGLPGDQRPDEALSRCYESETLTEDLHLLGRARVEVFVECSAPVLGLCAGLSDVAADGSSHLVAKGMLNVTRRESMRDPAPAKPGSVFPLTIELDASGWRFAPGHRIRLALSCADWPNVWPTPYPAQSLIHRGNDYPSKLVLPLVPAEANARPPDFRPAQTVKSRPGSAVDPPVWKMSRDLVTGRCEVEIRHGFKNRVSPLTVFERSEHSRFEVDPKDPARANGLGHHRHCLSSPGMVVESEAQVTVQGTPSHFQMLITLDVTVNGKPHFSRRWSESIPRHLL